MDADPTSPPSLQEEATATPRSRFQDAYETYFREVGAICSDLQLSVQDIQLEYQRALQLAWASQSQQEFVNAHDNFQRSYQALYTDAATANRYAAAYQSYKEALGRAMAALSPDELDPQTLAAIGQSMLVVARFASQTTWPSSANAPEPRQGA